MRKYLSIEMVDKSFIIDLSMQPDPTTLTIGFLSEEEYTKRSALKPNEHPLKQKKPSYRITSVALFIKDKGMFKRIDNQDILYIKASGSYCEMHTTSGIRTLACSLLHVYKQLNPSVFLRIHRSYAINTNHITRFCGNTCYVKDINKDAPIPISQQYHTVFLEMLNILVLNQKQITGEENENR